MKLILTYTGHDLDGALLQPVLPILIYDLDTAKRLFRAVALGAFEQDERDFSVFGLPFATRNFFRFVDDEQLERLIEVRAHQKKSPPVAHRDKRGRAHIFHLPRFESPDAWFDRVREAADATHAAAMAD